MNSLSWLLYLAGVSGNFTALFGWVGLLIIIGGVGMFYNSVAFKADSQSDIEPRYGMTEDGAYFKQRKADKESALQTSKSLGFWGKFCIITALVMWILGAALPSKETVYAIAASEMGEELLKTPTAAKATKALDAWLDKQIAENTKKAASQ